MNRMKQILEGNDIELLIIVFITIEQPKLIRNIRV